MTSKINNRRNFLKLSGATALSMPFVSRAWASTLELNMLAWYGHGEPDIVGEFEAANNVKFILHDLENKNPFDDMLHEDFTKFPGHWANGKLHSVMVRGGHLGVSYNKTAISEEEAQSYSCFWKNDVKGKVGHFDWHLPSLGMMSLYNGNGSGLWDLDTKKWNAVQDVTMSLRPQVGGYFDYGGTFNSLKNGEMLAMCGIGDWITGVLEKDGAPVGSVIPKEGGIQWTESYCIGKGTDKTDIIKKFINYMLSPEGQVKSAQMAAYPGFCITKAGRAALIEADPKEAKRSHQMEGMANDPIALINDGRIHYRDIPKQQSLEDWNDFWSEYKNA